MNGAHRGASRISGARTASRFVSWKFTRRRTRLRIGDLLMDWDIDNRHFYIREVDGEAEFHAVEDLQKEAWGFSDLDIVPAATLIATGHAGGSLLGAFERTRMIGFAYAFPAFEEGRVSMHSHMLAVKPEYRNYQAGYHLKLAQRELTLEKGIDEITWTFDPLQSLNAHLNFTKLGVISNRYIANFYGEQTSSPLHQGFGTDRLWVRWLLNGDRVKQCVSRPPGVRSQRIAAGSREAAEVIQSALIYGEDSRPMLGPFTSNLATGRCAIEIPRDINSLKDRDPGLGVEWREATRAAFLSAIEEGLVVSDFVRIDSNSTPRWFYSMRRSIA